MSRATAAPGRRAVLLGAASVGLARPAVGQGDRKILRFRPLTDLASVDPLATPSHSSVVAAQMLYDSLYALDASLTPQPQMAAGHECSDNGLTWRITLRDGLLFHDGEAVRSQDAIASIRRWSERDSVGIVLNGRTEAMRVLSDRQFEIWLTKPLPQLLFGLAHFAPFMLPEHIAATTPATTSVRDPTGSGPFVFVRDEWVSGSFAAFRRNERYVPRSEAPSLYAGGKVVNVDRVEWRTLPDPATVAAALRRNEIDWWDRAIPDLADGLRTAPGVVVERTDPFGVIGQLVFNNKLPPFDNPQLRQALLDTVDQAECAAAVVGQHPELMGTGVGLFSPGSPLANDAGLEAVTRAHDLGAARRKVAEAATRATGPPDGADRTISHERHWHDHGRAVSRRWAGRRRAVHGFRHPLQPPQPSRERRLALLRDQNSNGLTYANPALHFRLIAPVPDPKLVALREAWWDAPDRGEDLELVSRRPNQSPRVKRCRSLPAGCKHEEGQGVARGTPCSARLNLSRCFRLGHGGLDTVVPLHMALQDRGSILVKILEPGDRIICAASKTGILPCATNVCLDGLNGLVSGTADVKLTVN